MVPDNADDKLPTPNVMTSGGAYRATTTIDGHTWLCPHVHFTQQSARTCADQHVRKVKKASGSLSAPAA